MLKPEDKHADSGDNFKPIIAARADCVASALGPRVSETSVFVFYAPVVRQSSCGEHIHSTWHLGKSHAAAVQQVFELTGVILVHTPAIWGKFDIGKWWMVAASCA